MKCLVVCCHPLADSLCKQLTQSVSTQLENAGHQVSVDDLYADRFDPALNDSERSSYYEDTFQLSADNGLADRLQQAEALILVFPTWWFGFPAMLKGWFDRVWGPGIAFDHGENFGPIKPRLLQLKHAMVVTTLGSPWWVDRLIMRQPVKRVVKVALLGTCAKDCKLDFYSLYNSETITEQRIRTFTGKIQKALSKWPP